MKVNRKRRSGIIHDGTHDGTTSSSINVTGISNSFTPNNGESKNTSLPGTSAEHSTTFTTSTIPLKRTPTSSLKKYPRHSLKSKVQPIKKEKKSQLSTSKRKIIMMKKN